MLDTTRRRGISGAALLVALVGYGGHTSEDGAEPGVWGYAALCDGRSASCGVDDPKCHQECLVEIRTIGPAETCGHAWDTLVRCRLARGKFDCATGGRLTYPTECQQQLFDDNEC
ncbi:MAG: hypothetical protein R3B13_34425 [Polyangiaceae bacterium]